MNILKKIKFGHIVLVILLYMGINIGLKVQKIKEALYGEKIESTSVLLDTYDFDGKTIEFYYDESIYDKITIKMDGYVIKAQNGFYNKDKTKHIYIEQWNKHTIKQDGVIIEPIKKIESNKFENIYIYEFDINSKVEGKEIDKINDVNITSSILKNEELSIDYNKLESMMKSWRKMSDDEKIVVKYKQFDILHIENNWDEYDFRFNNFSPNNTSFDLYDNEKIIIGVNYNFYGYRYELTEVQYNEFIDMIKSSIK